MSDIGLDQPRPMRQGEELDLDALQAFLAVALSDFEGPIVAEQFRAGHSNLTYLLRGANRELVLRRPPFGTKVKTAHDMGREYTILSQLADVYRRVPRAVLRCDDPSILGAPFYLMERLRGVILRSSAPKGVDLPAPLMRKLSENLIDNLVDIHSLDYQAIGLGDLGRPAGYVRRQIEGWTRRYVDARTDDVPDVERVAAWLMEQMPEEAGAALIHNDYKYDNLVLDPQDLTYILGVLDWEMSTIGDPLMDLGTTLGYWVDPDDPQEIQSLPFGPTALPGNLSRRELAQRYAEKSSHDLSSILFYFVYGLFKIIVIVQQIYARYKAGLTQDERFAPLIMVVWVLGRTAVRAIAKNRIDDLGGN